MLLRRIFMKKLFAAVITTLFIVTLFAACVSAGSGDNTAAVGAVSQPTNLVDFEKFEGKQYLELSQYPDPFVISFKSEAHLEANSMLYVNEADVKEGGTYEFTDAALKLSYNESKVDWQGQYRVMFKLETVNFLDPAYTLVQVIYRTNVKSGELRLQNNGSADDFIVLDKDASKSGGEWVRSEVMELSGTMVKQLNSEMPVTLCLHTSDKDAYVELQEIKLFCSPDQVKLDMGLIEAAVDEEDEENVNTVTPMIYRFDSQEVLYGSGGRLYKHSDPNNPNEQGVFEYTQTDGENALRLYYDEHTNWPAYRAMIRAYSQSYAYKFNQSEKWYVRVRYKTDAKMFSQMTLTNNRDFEKVVLESNFIENAGEWCVSAPVELPKGLIDRLASNMWITLGFNFYEKDVEVYISEVGFFPTYESACEYYGDTPELASEASFVGRMKLGIPEIIVLGSDGNSDTTGYWERDAVSGSPILKYTPYDKHGWGNYRVMPAFRTITDELSTAKYFRIVYKAQNPENSEKVSLAVVSNSQRSVLIVEDDVKDTNGRWILSPVQEMSPIIKNRWLKAMHCTVSFYGKEGGEYSIGEIIFFASLEDAIAWEYDGDSEVEISVGGNPVESYTIVVPENAGRRTLTAADTLKTHIRQISGVSLEVITDAEPQRPYEIVVGNTSREVSAVYYSPNGGKYVTGDYGADVGTVSMVENTLLITGGSEIALEECMTEFLTLFFGYGAEAMPKKIALGSDVSYIYRASIRDFDPGWDDPAPVADPDVFTDNFNDEAIDSSPDYWVEAYATDNWLVKTDGAEKFYSTEADAFTYTRLHVYERDIDFVAKMRFDKFGADSDAGLLVRYNDAGAYVRVGYTEGSWYLRFSEGEDFNVYTLAKAPYEMKEGTWYTLRVTANKNDVKLYVNDALVLESQYVTHISPGPMGMFAENASVSFDDVSVTLVSGQGKVMKGVVDSTFWREEGWLCSGSVIETADKRVRYVHSIESQQYVSNDGGITWEKEQFTDITTDCVNIFRLQSGNLIKMMEETVDGQLYHVTYTSSDDGITWVRGGNIAAHDYKGYGTMIQTIENDKFSQVSSGRLFVSQNYQGSIPKGQPNDHMVVFNEIWYSDDEGKTWIQSNMSSYDCTDSTHVGETKVIETADGALLWITSWNKDGYIIASESTDNGVTWGKFYNLTDLSCSVSSYGIMRDEYADNDTTYYLAWVYNEPYADNKLRSRLCIAKTTDGRNWTFLGDVYRWECNWANSDGGMPINHIVDPFLTVTEDYLFVGSGFSNRRAYVNNGGHNNQQQKVYRIEKAALVAYDEFPNP